MDKKRVIIVNDKDEIIGHKEREKVNREDIYRVSALLITNSNGDILLAKRALTKKNDPGKWGPAAAGTNDEGETYDSNIKKEAEEEIGLKNCIFKKTAKKRRTGEHNFFVQYYTATIDKDISAFTLQEEEVAEIKWFSMKELAKEMQKNPSDFLPVVHEWLRENKHKEHRR